MLGDASHWSEADRGNAGAMLIVMATVLTATAIVPAFAFELPWAWPLIVAADLFFVLLSTSVAAIVSQPAEGSSGQSRRSVQIEAFLLCISAIGQVGTQLVIELATPAEYSENLPKSLVEMLADDWLSPLAFPGILLAWIAVTLGVAATFWHRRSELDQLPLPIPVVLFACANLLLLPFFGETLTIRASLDVFGMAIVTTALVLCVWAAFRAWRFDWKLAIPVWVLPVTAVVAAGFVFWSALSGFTLPERIALPEPDISMDREWSFDGRPFTALIPWVAAIVFLLLAVAFKGRRASVVEANPDFWAESGGEPDPAHEIASPSETTSMETDINAMQEAQPPPGEERE